MDTGLILAFEHVRHSQSLKPFSAAERESERGRRRRRRGAEGKEGIRVEEREICIIW